MDEEYYGPADTGYDPYTMELPEVSDIAGVPEITFQDTEGSLADVISDVPVDDRSDINAVIEAGNGYLGTGALDFLKDLPSDVWKTVKGLFTGADGKVNYGALSLAGGALMGLTGLGKAKSSGYQGTIPKMTAVRQQIDYNDPNRRPGAGGRRYFTDTQFAKTPAEVDPAKAAAKAQAEGILAGYKPAAAAAPVKSPFKTPWEKAAATVGTTGIGINPPPESVALPQIPNALEIAKATYPEKFQEPRADFVGPVSTPPDASEGPPALDISHYQPPSLSAKLPFAAGGATPMNEPRYLRGITDGMEDKINTSIDGQQPAKLSHGEFVIPADVVSHLGNGNSDAGAKKLYQMMDRVRHARTGTTKQGKQINPDKFMPGGQVGYQSGGIVAFEAGGSTGTTQESSLSNWAGDYVTDTLGKAQAAADQPYQAYTGPLTAGASDLQQQAFAGVQNLAQTGYTPGTFTTGTFDAGQAAKYMNPYISQALDPQLKELRRQAQIGNLGTLAKAGSAGIMGGSRRDLMEAENMRNLLGKQADVLGQGYATAYDKAMGQFNTEQTRGLDAQRAEEASRQFSANYGKGILDQMAGLGATQRGIEAEGIAADKAEFEKQRDWDLAMQQAKIAMLQKLPVQTTSTSANVNPIVEALMSSGNILKLLQGLGMAPTEGTAATKSAGKT